MDLRTNDADRDQIAAVHEFGHLIGLDHPDPKDPYDQYRKDPNALMGTGMELRTYYFKRWAEYLDGQYRGSGPYRVVIEG